MHRFVFFVSTLLLLACTFAPVCAQEAVQALTAERERALKPADSFRECDVCPEMVVAPAGAFTMGSPDIEKGRNTWEGPSHVVTFARPFAVGKFEVSVDQFAAFVRETRYDVGTTCWTLEDGKLESRAGRSWRNPGFEQDGSHPATCLNWHDAKAYADWLARKTGGKGYRLLSEAEWEYAASARTTPGAGPRFAFGDDESALCTHGDGLDQDARRAFAGTERWTFLPCNDGYAFTAPAGKYIANAFGLHDMQGNVKEWTQDCFQEGQGYRGAPTDGSAWTSGTCRSRVLRGGSWLSFARLLRVAFRFTGTPGERLNDVGIRVARTLQTP